MAMKILHLHVKKKYFDQIKSGEKKEEYRRMTPYWQKQLLLGPDFKWIMVYCGYPRRGDTGRIIKFRYKGLMIKSGFIHPEFGDKPVNVFVIPLREES